jgi:hypothetical protein
MRFEITLEPKRLIFDSDLHGLRMDGVDYLSGRDGVLIYDKSRDLLQTNEVELQMSTNTSTLIPALRALGIPYAPYCHEAAARVLPLDTARRQSFFQESFQREE